MEQKFTVTGMPHAHVASDASFIELTFSTTESEQIKLVFDSAQFDNFSTKAIQLFTHVRSQTLAIGGHLAVQPVPVVRAGAESTVGGAKVILSLIAENQVPFHFSLEPDECRHLRPLMRSAEESARRQRAQLRQ